MKVIDPGHHYELEWLDGAPTPYYDDFKPSELIFVKREGEGYPGNVGHYPGTNLQEVLRACIDRVKYLHKQVWDFNNNTVLNDLRHAIYKLEERAARRHGRELVFNANVQIEDMPTCEKCGHICCEGQCHP